MNNKVENYNRDKIDIIEKINILTKKYKDSIIGFSFERNSNEPMIEFLFSGVKLESYLKNIQHTLNGNQKPLNNWDDAWNVFNKEYNSLIDHLKEFTKKYDNIIERISFRFDNNYPKIDFETKSEVKAIEEAIKQGF